MKLIELYLNFTEQLNSATKFPSILTLHKLENGRITPELTTKNMDFNHCSWTEKIDGVNSRAIIYGEEILYGSREEILGYNKDFLCNPKLQIAETLRKKSFKAFQKSKNLFVVYGEVFGGQVTQKSKNYGTQKTDFRVFDVARFDFKKLESLCQKPIEEISKWREHNSPEGLVYGQDFLDLHEIDFYCRNSGVEMVPSIISNLAFGDLSINRVYEVLKESIPKTHVALSESALKVPEGMVLRDKSGKKRVKIRFEDYEKYFSKK